MWHKWAVEDAECEHEWHEEMIVWRTQSFWETLISLIESWVVTSPCELFPCPSLDVARECDHDQRGQRTVRGCRTGPGQWLVKVGCCQQLTAMQENKKQKQGEHVHWAAAARISGGTLELLCIPACSAVAPAQGPCLIKSLNKTKGDNERRSSFHRICQFRTKKLKAVGGLRKCYHVLMWDMKTWRQVLLVM